MHHPLCQNFRLIGPQNTIACACDLFSILFIDQTISKLGWSSCREDQITCQNNLLRPAWRILSGDFFSFSDLLCNHVNRRKIDVTSRVINLTPFDVAGGLGQACQRHPFDRRPIQKALQISLTGHASISATIASICARRSVIRATVVAISAFSLTIFVNSRVSFGST